MSEQGQASVEFPPGSVILLPPGSSINVAGPVSISGATIDWQQKIEQYVSQ